MHAFIFLLTSLVALGFLGLLPDRGMLAAKARLQALESVGPGLVHVADARAWQVRDRRKAKARRKRLFERASFVGRAALLMLACGGATGLAFRFMGTEQVIAMLALVGTASVVLVPVAKASRVRTVTRQIPRALELLAGHLEASNSFFGAIDAVAASGPWPIRDEFRRVAAALRSQATVDQAFLAFAGRNPTPEAHLVARILSAPLLAGQSMVPALHSAQTLLAALMKAEAGAARWNRLRTGWVVALAVFAGVLVVRGLFRPAPPVFLAAALSAGSALLVAAWWFARQQMLQRTRLEGRLGLLDLDNWADPDADVDAAQRQTVRDNMARPRTSDGTLLGRLLTLGAGQSRRVQRLSDAAARALCHVACMLGVGLSLESAIGAVVLRPGARGRLEQELFTLLQEVRSGAPPHAAALALAGRCEVPELSDFATALTPGAKVPEAMEATARACLVAWPGRARSAALASCGLATGAALAALLPLAGLAFAP